MIAQIYNFWYLHVLSKTYVGYMVIGPGHPFCLQGKLFLYLAENGHIQSWSNIFLSWIERARKGQNSEKFWRRFFFPQKISHQVLDADTLIAAFCEKIKPAIVYNDNLFLFTFRSHVMSIIVNKNPSAIRNANCVSYLDC